VENLETIFSIEVFILIAGDCTDCSSTTHFYSAIRTSHTADCIIGSRVVILGVWRLTDGLVGGLAHYALHEPGILDIFFDYSLKYLKYTRICSNISLSGGHGGLPGVAGGRSGREGRHTDNPDWKFIRIVHSHGLHQKVPSNVFQESFLT
jgi:hypothetical protein